MIDLSRVLSGACLLAVLAPSVCTLAGTHQHHVMYVGYNTRKATVNPTGELKAQLDSLDRDLQTANQQGRLSEVRRLLARGTTLLAGRQWTDIAAYNASCCCVRIASSWSRKNRMPCGSNNSMHRQSISRAR